MDESETTVKWSPNIIPLTPCPDCGNQCSTSANACPKCGCPLKSNEFGPDEPTQSGRRLKERLSSPIIPLTILVVIIVCAVLYWTGVLDSQFTTQTTPIGSTDGNSETQSELSNSANPSNPISKPTPIPTIQDGIVEFKVGVVYLHGGTQPVARETFYILNSSLESIVHDARLNDTYSGGLAGLYELIQSHAIQTTMTDFDGNGTFQRVPLGTYYLCGIAKTRGGRAIWDLPIIVKPGTNSFILDQKNATSAY